MTDDLAEALTRVTPELEPDPELVVWAEEALLAGRELESVVVELTDQGWPAADAEVAVEAARVRTRRERGVVTREDVVGDLHARYRRSSSGMAAFYRSAGGPVGIVAFATGLRQAIAAAKHLSRLARADHGPTAGRRPR